MTGKLFRSGLKRLSTVKRLLQLGRQTRYVLFDTWNTVYLLDDRKMVYPKQLELAKKFETPADAARAATELYGLWAVVPVLRGEIVGAPIYVPNATGSAGPTQSGGFRTDYLLPVPARERKRP